MDVYELIGKLVVSARAAYRMDDGMRKLGYANNPYADFFGNIADALYSLLGEDTSEFTVSATYRTLVNPSLPDTRCAEILCHEYEKNIANAYIDHRMVV